MSLVPQRGHIFPGYCREVHQGVLSASSMSSSMSAINFQLSSSRQQFKWRVGPGLSLVFGQEVV